MLLLHYQGIKTWQDVVEYLQKLPRKTYEDRAKIYGYDLEKANKEVIRKIDEYVKEINQSSGDGTLTIERLREILDDTYMVVDNRKAF